MTFRSKIIIAVSVAGVLSSGLAIFVSSNQIHSLGIQQLTEKSQSILSRLESVRGYVASQGGLDVVVREMKGLYPNGELPKEAKLKVLKQVPVFAAMKVGAENSEAEGYEFRVFAEEPRNEKKQTYRL